ncbi:class A beta-lactamase [Arthrobacter sp. ATA002]|uniref:class A beta-lactamase n=1 Tax=Arthrobacter sp. ATA002 TaxID=2991715 RepID=UPI0022A6D457|nr:class A beta-lactamase [Arthrobacter sp. ATA002]WAP51522.1 class A beta-lactamase [Arthrobacter sp. ATA002]
MTTPSSRSAAALGAASLLLALAACAGTADEARSDPAVSVSVSGSPAAETFTSLEERHAATLGVYAIDTGSGHTVEYRANERFGYTSTIKALSAAAVLDAATDDQLNDPIAVGPEDIVAYAPVMEEHVGSTVTLGEVADAAVRFSDNTAGNLLVEYLGGPAGLEESLRGIGDETTNVDRIEPGLNEVAPGDDRDTSTPRALATSLFEYALGGALNAQDEEVLIGMLKGNTTGDALIRSGAPAGWEIGDKTGAGAYGTRNDVAVAFPADGGAPIVIAVLSKRGEPDAKYDDALIADAAEVAFGVLPSQRG